MQVFKYTPMPIGSIESSEPTKYEIHFVQQADKSAHNEEIISLFQMEAKLNKRRKKQRQKSREIKYTEKERKKEKINAEAE